MIQTYTLRKPVKAIRYNGKNFEKIKAFCGWSSETRVWSTGNAYFCGRFTAIGDWVVVDNLNNVSVYKPNEFRKLFKRVAK